MTVSTVHERSAALVTGNADATLPFTSVPLNQARGLLYLGVPERRCSQCGIRLPRSDEFNPRSGGVECRPCRVKTTMRVERQWIERAVMMAPESDIITGALESRFGWGDDDDATNS